MRYLDLKLGQIKGLKVLAPATLDYLCSISTDNTLYYQYDILNNNPMSCCEVMC